MPRFILPLCLSLVALLSSTVSGQSFPDIGRWAGGTAQSQAQGFSQGDPLRLTWGFVDDGLNIPNFGDPGAAAPSNLDARFSSIYGSQAAYRAVFQSVFDRWSSLSGIDYQFESADDGASFAGFGSTGVTGVRADVRIGGRNIDGDYGILAFNFGPSNSDMVVDTNDNFFEVLANDSRAGRNVLAHENGHGLGMGHVTVPTAETFLMEGATTDNPPFDGPQLHDVLIAQRGYGDVNEKSNAQEGNDIVENATDLGTIADGATSSIGNDARDLFVNFDEVDFVSIDDATDTDFFSFTVDQESSVDILLEALGVTYSIGGGDFDATQRSNLALQIFGTDGTTLLGSVDASGLGGDEVLNGIVLDQAGTYFVRVTGQDNADSNTVDTQFFGLSISVTSAAIPEPGSMAIICLLGTAALIRRRR